jgi:Serine dehydrogenase proteinase
MTDMPAETNPRTIKQPPVLLAQTQRIVHAVEATLGAPLVTYWNSTSGSICSNDVVGLYALLKSIGKVERLYIFIKSGGGFGEASLRMTHLLRQFAGELIALVPLECESAATMLALGADQILMGPLAQLSAVDTSLKHDLSPIDRDNNRVRVSQDELSRVVRLWQEQASDRPVNPYVSLYDKIHPLVIGAVDRASALSTRLCIDILSYHMKDRAKAEQISNMLNSAYPSHSYPITLREAARIGLNVAPLDEALNQNLLELNELYSEMGQAASTDYDQISSHDASILNILEGNGTQIFFQNDKDWHYRVEERRWVTLNDNSGWRRAEMADGKPVISVLHVR